MGSYGTQRRMGRIFGRDGRTVIVAMDHAGGGSVPGLEHPKRVIEQVQEGGADAILTTYGMLCRFGNQMGKLGVILRADGGHAHLATGTQRKVVFTAEHAVRAGADAVATMLFPGLPDAVASLTYVPAMATDAAQWGVPFMAEALPYGFQQTAEARSAENVGHACRLGAELGADFVKTNYTGTTDTFRAVVDQCYVPLVILGGGRIDDERVLLTQIYDSLRAGGAGVAIGRNVWQHHDPRMMTRAITAIVHDDATVEQAYRMLSARLAI